MRRFPSFSQVELSSPAPDEVVKDCLNGAINHEAKSLTAIFYSSRHDAALGGTAVAEAINEAQGVGTISPASISHYCEINLDPIAHIVHRDGDLWRANPADKVSNQEVADTIVDVLQRKGSCSLDKLHAEMDTPL
ncbi:MAG TPA: hypothetical protein VF733_00070 [Candidatus Saccharimonadales bacterium]